MAYPTIKQISKHTNSFLSRFSSSFSFLQTKRARGSNGYVRNFHRAITNTIKIVVIKSSPAKSEIVRFTFCVLSYDALTHFHTSRSGLFRCRSCNFICILTFESSPFFIFIVFTLQQMSTKNGFREPFLKSITARIQIASVLLCFFILCKKVTNPKLYNHPYNHPSMLYL